MVEHAARDQPTPDIRLAVRAAIGSTATREEMVSVASRLVALTNILANPELRPWLAESGKNQSTVNMAVLKAAACAPLFQTERPADLTFDMETFKSILIEESPPQSET